MDVLSEEEYRRAEKRAMRRDSRKQEDDLAVQAEIDYYDKPQTEIQLNSLYLTPESPHTPDKGTFPEWTRDSILSNYTTPVLKKIGWCVEEIRILEMMKADALRNNDKELVRDFCDPLIRFNMSEKYALENGHRNIDGYAGQLSRSTFNNIQQFRYSEDYERQGRGGGFLGKLKLPKFGRGWSGGGGERVGWDSPY